MSSQVVLLGLGCMKYPELQAVHYVLSPPVQSWHLLLHISHMLFTVSGQYPIGVVQVVKQVEEFSAGWA